MTISSTNTNYIKIENPITKPDNHNFEEHLVETKTSSQQTKDIGSSGASSHMLSLMLAGWFQKKLEAETINFQEALGNIDANQKESMKQSLEDTHTVQKTPSNDIVKMLDLKTYMKNVESFSTGESEDGLDVKG